MFSGHEILEIAVNIEVEGEKFYRTISKDIKDSSAKNTFDYLANQEEKHIETFKSLLKRFDEESRELVNWDEATEYLKAMSSHKVFPDADALIEKFRDSTTKEIIEYALDREKDSIIFYYEIIEMIDDRDIKDAVRKIISEEKSHVATLKEFID
ncbi:MAG: ferritin family protein [Kosmotoga sp.]|nr:MAG: ferritin family protein [Kosmotoga sp.]